MIRKIPSILQSYLYFLLFKAGFINDVNYKKVLSQRIASCENCVLRKGKWCSKHKSVVGVYKGKKYKTVSGCGCIWKIKIFDNTPNCCPMGKWINHN